MGKDATASAKNSVALGYDSVAKEEDTVSVGRKYRERRITNVATGVNDTDAVNLGQVTSLISAVDVLWVDSAATRAASATGSNATAIGSSSTASASNSVALGYGSKATEANTVSVGSKYSQRRITNVATALNGTDAVNLDQVESLISTSGEKWLSSSEGNAATVSGSNATAIGSGSAATADGSVALGQGSIADEANTVSLGSGSMATATNAIALGFGSVADEINTVSVGTSPVSAASPMSPLPSTAPMPSTSIK